MNRCPKEGCKSKLPKCSSAAHALTSSSRRVWCQVNEKPFEDLKHCTAALTRARSVDSVPLADSHPIRETQALITGGNRKKPWVFAPRPRRSPQRVARACWKSQKTMGFCTSTTPIPAEGRAGMLEIAKKAMGFCTSTTPIPAEGRASTAEIAKNHGFLHLDHADGRAGMLEIAKNHGFLHLDHADPRRGSRGHVGNRKKTMGFCTSTTPIPAEGRAGMLEIAKNHGFLHLDHADPRRGSIFV